jgi:tetratricopeptide (TPR) repeat protein
MAKEKEQTSFTAGSTIFGANTSVSEAFCVINGRVQVFWKWETWDSFFYGKGSYFGLLECLFDTKTQYSVQAVEDSFLLPLSKADIQSPETPEEKRGILHSLALMLEQVIQQKHVGLPLTEQEKMYMAFEAFIKKGDKQRAIDCYTKFITSFPNSTYVDRMLNYIQDISLGKDITVEIPESEEEAFFVVMEQATHEDPQQNLILLKNYEEKYPQSPNYEKILNRIIIEYEKLGDEYQLNYYLRKYIYTFPQSETTARNLLSLISLQRRSGEPSWYENAIRFLFYFPDSEFIAVVKKFLGIDV